jgi:hypothetical protein
VIYCFSNYKRIKAHFNLNDEKVLPGVLYTHEASV